MKKIVILLFLFSFMSCVNYLDKIKQQKTLHIETAFPSFDDEDIENMKQNINVYFKNRGIDVLFDTEIDNLDMYYLKINIDDIDFTEKTYQYFAKVTYTILLNKHNSIIKEKRTVDVYTVPKSEYKFDFESYINEAESEIEKLYREIQFMALTKLFLTQEVVEKTDWDEKLNAVFLD